MSLLFTTIMNYVILKYYSTHVYDYTHYCLTSITPFTKIAANDKTGWRHNNE